MSGAGDTSFDVIIVGGGLMGSAAAWRLAADGRTVLVLDRYQPGHLMGSSHTHSRIIRLAYASDDYVELARKSYARWRDLEADAGEPLMHVCGGLDLGLPDAEYVDEIRDCYVRNGIPHEMLDRDGIVARFPQFRLPEGMRGVYQPDYALLAADDSVAAFARVARERGAIFHYEEPALELFAGNGAATVKTARGRYTADRLILAAGSWMRPLVRQLGLDLPLYLRKEFLVYLTVTDPAAFAPGRFPLVIHRFPGNLSLGSFFPSYRHEGVKALIDRLGRIVDPEDPDRDVDAGPLEMVRQYAMEMLPQCTGEVTWSGSCRYTMTPDEHFVIDQLPGQPNVVIASPCSGHGFKFAPVIGDILADLATDGATGHDISRFRIDRPALAAPLAPEYTLTA
ncbi:MAG: N-methyl-L-tryptophan oxidase [Chloroflexota bacterium]